jgi:thioredoxin 1
MNITRRYAIGFTAALLLFPALVSAPTVNAAAKAGFTQSAFETALASGESILVEVHAPWCPTCKAQAPILAELTAHPKFADLVVLQVDFDTQKDALRLLKAQRQSTLIIFKGGEEVDRSVGETRREQLAALLDKAA